MGGNRGRWDAGFGSPLLRLFSLFFIVSFVISVIFIIPFLPGSTCYFFVQYWFQGPNCFTSSP